MMHDSLIRRLHFQQSNLGDETPAIGELIADMNSVYIVIGRNLQPQIDPFQIAGRSGLYLDGGMGD
jgi:hypothetical protein